MRAGQDGFESFRSIVDEARKAPLRMETARGHPRAVVDGQRRARLSVADVNHPAHETPLGRGETDEEDAGGKRLVLLVAPVP